MPQTQDMTEFMDDGVRESMDVYTQAEEII